MARARSGRGITMNKNVKIGFRHGQPSKAINPGAADQIGQTVAFNKPPLVEGKGESHSVKFGNEVALNVGSGGPGKGRTVHKSGSQGSH